MTESSKKDVVSTLESYRKIIYKRMFWLVVLSIAIIICLLVDVSLGSSGLGLLDIMKVILNPVAFSQGTQIIVWDIRFPQAIMAVLVGAALGLAGAEMQTVLNNPLASPFTLGVSHAAAFGAALAIVLSVGIPGIQAKWLVAGNAFIFALLATLLLDILARWRQANTNVIVLFGIAIGFTFSALVALLQYVATAEALQTLVFWTMGSMARADWQNLTILAVAFAIAFPCSMMAAWKLTALRLGEDRAASFGINIKRLRLASLLRISILSGLAVAFVGTIGFIGLVGPHIARMLFGEDHRFYLPASALAGALIMSLAAIISKNIVHGVLIPVGIITSLIGIPFFLAIIFRITAGGRE